MLTVTQLLGFNAAETPAQATFVTSSTNVTALTTYTFSALSLGKVGLVRIIAIAISSGTLRTINSVTVDGVSAVAVGNTDSGANTVAIWLAATSANATGDVVVTLSGAAARLVVAVYSVLGLQSTTARDTGTDNTLTSNALSDIVDVPAGGFAIAVAYTAGGNSRTTTWTNLGENYDTVIETQTATGAFSNFATTQTALTVTATFSGTSSAAAFFIASFR